MNHVETQLDQAHSKKSKGEAQVSQVGEDAIGGLKCGQQRQFGGANRLRCIVVNIFAALWYADSNRCAGGVDASWGAWGRLSNFLEAS